jgi:hypothetical protein
MQELETRGIHDVTLTPVTLEELFVALVRKR